MAYFRSFFKLKQNFMYREVVLNEVNIIYHKKFELKITLNFLNISMCYTEMKPLWDTLGFRCYSGIKDLDKVNLAKLNYGVKVLGSNWYSLLSQLPQKMMLDSKVVKSDFKIILSIC